MQANESRERGPQRLDGVDVLRGLSIAAVVLLHIAIRMRIAGFTLQPAMPAWLFHLLFRNGNNGVTVFFAISGFLITLTSLRRFGSLGEVRPGRFYRIRFARIAPMLLALLAMLSVLHLANAEGFRILPQRSNLPRALFAALTFHLNWLEAAHGYLPPNWDVLWSLSVEEMFYLAFPIACVALFRTRAGMAGWVVLLAGLVVMGPFARTVWAGGNEVWQEKTYLGGMDGIALGCLCALVTDRLKGRGRGWIAVEIGGAAMMLAIALRPSLVRGGLDGSVLAAGTCLVTMASVLRGRVGGWGTAPIRWLGRHSYEVYMTHEFAVVWGTQAYVKWHAGPLGVWFAGIALVSVIPGLWLDGTFRSR